jgi:hypothetical protein
VVSRTPVSKASLCALYRPPQGDLGDGVRERDLAVDSHHGKVDAVAPLELVVTVDHHAAQVETERGRFALEHREGARTEPAAGALVEHDLDAARRGR